MDIKLIKKLDGIEGESVRDVIDKVFAEWNDYHGLDYNNDLVIDGERTIDYIDGQYKNGNTRYTKLGHITGDYIAGFKFICDINPGEIFSCEGRIMRVGNSYCFGYIPTSDVEKHDLDTKRIKAVFYED